MNRIELVVVGEAVSEWMVGAVTLNDSVSRCIVCCVHIIYNQTSQRTS